MKAFQSQKKNNLPQKKSKIIFSAKKSTKPQSDNLLEIENYTPPKKTLPKIKEILSHEGFQKQLQIQKNNLASNIKKLEVKKLEVEEDETDNIPTKENGMTFNSGQKAV